MDFQHFLKRSSECEENDVDFEKALTLFDDWKENIRKEGTLNDYIDLIKEYRYLGDFIETGQKLFLEWRAKVNYSYNEYL